MSPRILHHKVPRASIISESEVRIHYGSLFAMFTLLHSSMNQELFESTSVIKVATTKNTMVLHAPVNV